MYLVLKLVQNWYKVSITSGRYKCWVILYIYEEPLVLVLKIRSSSNSVLTNWNQH
jgi:hypothetical protein